MLGVVHCRIQEQRGERLALTVSQCDRLGEPIGQQEAVRQASQRIELADMGHQVRHEDGRCSIPITGHAACSPRSARPPKLPETVTLHALRHTYGSLLLADARPIKHVSEQLGHAKTSITMDIYQHVLRATSATATRLLDKHIPAEKPACGSSSAAPRNQPGARSRVR